MKSFALCLVASLGIGPSARADAGPCGGIRLADGHVELGTPLPTELEGLGGVDALVCLDALAERLAERPTLRAITIAARIPEHARDGRDPLALAETVAAHLARRLGEGRVSAVAPGTRVDEVPSLQIAFVERRARRPIAQIGFAGGNVRAGFAADALTPAHLGQLLAPLELVVTGPASVAVVRLADQSQLWIAPSSSVRLGRAVVGGPEGRDVAVEVLSGHAEVLAHPARGRFEVGTPAAIAGVRGTTFRVTSGASGTRLETLEGAVALDNPQGSARVEAGQGSRAERGAAPEAPRALLAAPHPGTALHGDLRPGEPLSWHEVAGAARYEVMLARDAGFTEAFESRNASGPRLAVPADLAPGRWYWRVRAIDADGFVGLPSKIYAFQK